MERGRRWVGPPDRRWSSRRGPRRARTPPRGRTFEGRSSLPVEPGDAPGADSDRVLEVLPEADLPLARQADAAEREDGRPGGNLASRGGDAVGAVEHPGRRVDVEVGAQRVD